MSLAQSKQVVPPVPTDSTLANFSQIVQSNLVALFQAAHAHKIVTGVPKSNDGSIGDIYLGDLAAGKKIYVKLGDGWYSAALTKV